jgi:hypothetical protein
VGASTELFWGIDDDTVAYGAPLLWDDCGVAVPRSTAAPEVATTPVEGELAPNRASVWDLTVTAEATVRLRAELPTWTEPVLWIADGAGCALLEARDNVTCASPIVAPGDCPALETTLPPGAYRVVLARDEQPTHPDELGYPAAARLYAQLDPGATLAPRAQGVLLTEEAPYHAELTARATATVIRQVVP